MTRSAHAAQPALGVDRRGAGPRPRSRISRAVPRLYGVLALCLVAYLISVIVRPKTDSSIALDGWGVTAFEVVASLLCIARGVVARRGRVIPLLLGFALLSWSIGDAVLTSESAGGATPTAPLLADAFYLTFYPLTYLGVGLLVRRRAKLFNVTWLDGAVAGLGAAAICAQFALANLSHSLGGGTASVATDLAYPVGDLLLLALVAGGTTVLPGRPEARWVLLAMGCAINAVGDTFNLFHSSIGATQLGVVLNAVAWPAAILLVSASVWMRPPHRRPLTHERSPGSRCRGSRP